MKKRGYVFPDLSVPEIPKIKYAKDVKELQDINQNLYKIGEYASPETGELIPGEQGREYEKKKRYKTRAKEKQDDLEYGYFDIFDTITTNIIENFPETRYVRRGKTIVIWDGSTRKFTLLDLWRNTISEAIENEETRDLKNYIENREAMVSECVNKIQYDSKEEVLNSAFSQLVNILSWKHQMSKEQYSDLDDVYLAGLNED